MPNIRANIKPNTDKVVTPLAYVLHAIILRNHKGQEADIQNIVVDFSITESLYSSSLIARFNVKDAANFIEEFQLIGQETIEVKFGRHDYTSKEWVNHSISFYVSEYPMFGRDKQQNTQIYSITAISPHAYISNFKRISKAVSGTTSNIIRRILTQDLAVPDSLIGTFEQASSNFRGVIPLMHPLDATYWLLRRTYDSDTNPFFLHQTLSGKLHLHSLTSLIDEKKNPVYRTYNDDKLYSALPGTEEDYTQRIERIYDISSEFKLSKVLPTISRGAFASKTTFVDLSSKTILTEEFNYSKSFEASKTLNKYVVLSPKFKIPYDASGQTRALNNTQDCYTQYIPTNQYAYSTDGSIKTYHDLMVHKAGKYNSIIENMDTIVHDITVAGDFRLESGQMIEVKIPKAIDLMEFKSETMKGNYDDLYDRTVSGKYLITSIIHQFGQQYQCRMRIKRDSLTYDITSS